MLRAAARRLSGAAASTAHLRGGGGRLHPTTTRLFGSEPHNDDWEANYEDLLAMEDSYGSGVEDLSSAALEMANARMAEQKRLRAEMQRLRGIQVGDRVRVSVRQGAPYPEPIKRYHYTSPFGGADLGHQPSSARRAGAGGGNVADADEIEGFAFAAAEGGSGATAGGGGGGGGGGDVGAGTGAGGGGNRRWKIVQTQGYVVAVRGNRVGIKRSGHLEDTDKSFPTYPKDWVKVLDVGEMWEMKTGPRNLGAFASEDDDDYAQAQQAWADAAAATTMRPGPGAGAAGRGPGARAGA